MITAHCRRVRRVRDGEHWDWVPAFVRTPAPSTTHGLCPLCFELYYPSD